MVGNKLHLIPSGIFSSQRKVPVIGNGVSGQLKSLVKELNIFMRKVCFNREPSYLDCAHVILPYHIKLDQLQRSCQRGNKIGTTNSVLGLPIWVKAARGVSGIVVDLWTVGTADRLKQTS